MILSLSSLNLAAFSAAFEVLILSWMKLFYAPSPHSLAQLSLVVPDNQPESSFNYAW
tara:strand:- start:243 stop:413 length:171 start_codon:yes stop_codon:yes gene_type:complete